MANFALLIWPFIAIPFFLGMGPARGLIWSVFVGYMFLPEAIEIDLPGLPSYNKLSAISICSLLGVLLTKNRLETSATVLVDLLPMRMLMMLLAIICILSPLGTWATNPEALITGEVVRPGLGISDIINMSNNMVMRFIPLVLAAYLLRTEALQRELIIALVVAAFAYTPLVLFEWRMSPQLHTWVYGYFQHSWIQHNRSGGFRPIVFLSHGLVVGLFLMTAVLGALTLSRDKTLSRGLFILIAFWLILILVMSRNFGAFMLAILFLPVALMFSARAQVRIAAIIAVILVAYPAVKQAGLSPDTRILAMVAPISPERAQSFNTRLENEDMLLARAAEKPVFGWGGWARMRVYTSWGRDLTIVDGLWVIIISQFGWVGYVSFFGALFAPILFMRRAVRRKPLTPVIGGFAVIMCANMIDLIPNSTISPLAMLMLGAMHAFLRYDPVKVIDETQLEQTGRDRSLRYSRFPASPGRQANA